MSHLTQVSGLKFFAAKNAVAFLPVSPYTGEWIEINSKPSNSDNADWSHLTQVSGLKCFVQSLDELDLKVSPYTGEWIEMVF